MNSIPEKNLISTKDASALSGYNADYLARLCRAGKIDGSRVGRAWLVSQESLEAFVKEQGVHKQELRSTLSKIRGKEYHTPHDFTNKTNKHIVTFDDASESALVTAPRTSTYTLFQKRGLAVLAALVVMLIGVYGAQATPLAEIGNTSLTTALTVADGFDTIVGNAIQHADDQALQNIADSQSLSPLTPKNITASSSTQPTIAFSNSLGEVQLANAVASLAIVSTTPSQTPTLLSKPQTFVGVATQSMPTSHSPSSQNLIDDVGNAALSFGIDIRDIGTALPDILATNEIGAAIAFSQFSDNILHAYSNGVYSWVKVTPLVPAVLTQHAYDAGTNIADAVGLAPQIVATTFNAGVNAWVTTTPEIAANIIKTEIALGTPINAIGSQAVSSEEIGVKTAGYLAYDQVSRGNQTLAQASAVASYISASTEDTVLGVAGVASLNTERVPGVIAKTSGSLAAAIVPAQTQSIFQQIALVATNIFNNLFADANTVLVFLTGNQGRLAVVPSIYGIPPPSAGSVGYTLPISSSPAATGNKSTGAVTQNITNETFIEPAPVQGASQSYVDDSIANLRNLMFEQVDTIVGTLSRNSSGGGGSSSSGGTTLAPSSDINIDGITANTGNFGALTVTGSSTLSSLSAATSSFVGPVTITGNVNITGTVSASSFLGVSTTTNIAPYFIATSTTATSTFAGDINVSGTAAFATATVQNLNATNSTSTSATSTNLYAANSIFNNLLATIANFTTAFINNLTATNATITNAIITNATSTNATSTNLFSTNLIGTNFKMTNATSTNGYISQLTSDNAVLTAATSTNFFASLANFGSISVGNLNGFLKATNGVVSTSTSLLI